MPADYSFSRPLARWPACCSTHLLSAPVTMGVMSPLGVATATEMSTAGEASIAPLALLHFEFTCATQIRCKALTGDQVTSDRKQV